MQDKRRFFSGATLDQAVARAARHYGVDPEQLEYREREKRHGFLHRRRGVVVEVNPSALTREPEAPPVEAGASAAGRSAEAGGAEAEASAAGTAPSEDIWRPESDADPVSSSSATDGSELFSAEWWQDEGQQGEPGSGAATEVAPRPAERSDSRPVSPRAQGASAEVAEKGLNRLLELAGVSLTSEIRQGEDRLEVELSGNDQRVVLERGGEVLLALEHLLPRVIRGLSGAGVPCRVDADGFHASREARLRELAERRAGEVLRSRRRRTLPPMSPEERRIVHLTLADRTDVSTESRGEGFFKRVTIFPGGQP